MEKDQHFVYLRHKNKMIISGAAWISTSASVPKVATTKTPVDDQEAKELHEEQPQSKNE